MIIIAAIFTVIAAAGLAYLAHLLRRDRHVIWHPGDRLPHIPEDAPIRHWREPAAGKARAR